MIIRSEYVTWRALTEKWVFIWIWLSLSLSVYIYIKKIIREWYLFKRIREPTKIIHDFALNFGKGHANDFDCKLQSLANHVWFCTWIIYDFVHSRILLNRYHSRLNPCIYIYIYTYRYIEYIYICKNLHVSTRVLLERDSKGFHISSQKLWSWLNASTENNPISTIFICR